MGLFKKKKNSKAFSRNNYPKCNCDGCDKQETCEYGHVVYDDFNGSRLSLVDKFIQRYTFNANFEPQNDDYSDIATNEERHDLRKLRKLDKGVLEKTLQYLEEERELYFNAGKCGRAYYNYMNMRDELQLVKESLKSLKKNS